MTTYIAVFRTAGRNWVQGTHTRQQPFWDEHAAYIDALFDAGKVVFAGPYTDHTGSLLIFNSEDASAAIEALRGDPWIIHEILAPDTAKPWTLYLDSRM